MSQTYVVREDDERGVARVTLDREAARNALSPALVEELSNVFGRLAHDRHVRVIVLTGRGRAFSAGADLEYLEKIAGSGYDANLADSTMNDELFDTILGCPQPIVARVNGPAVGGGAALVACADIAIAARSAFFAFAEVRVGIVPAVISTYVIEKIGLAASRQLLLTGQRFDAERGRAIGLVHDVVDDDALDDATDAAIAEVLTAWPGAQQSIKQLLATSTSSSRDEYRARAIRVGAEVRASEEGRRAINDFLEQARRRSEQRRQATT